MTGARMEFGFDDSSLRKELWEHVNRLENTEPFLKSIGEEFVGAGGIINRRFKEQKGPDGDGWQPMSAKWAARRMKKYPNAPLTLLRMRGHLAGSINYQTSSNSLNIGTGPNVEHYAGVHQFGFEGGEGNQNIPARPYLGFADEDWDLIEEEAIDYFMPNGTGDF